MDDARQQPASMQELLDRVCNVSQREEQVSMNTISAFLDRWTRPRWDIFVRNTGTSIIGAVAILLPANSEQKVNFATPARYFPSG